MLLAVVTLCLLSQTAPVAPVKIETEASGVTLVERASKKVSCKAPCGERVSTLDATEYVLQAPGALESDPFSLRDATTEVTIGWRPATNVTRIFGAGLIAAGGAAVLTAIAMGVAALVVGTTCGHDGGTCPSLSWAWATLPLSVGGYIAVGIGMTLTFRFGIEKLEIEIAPPPVT